MTISTLKNKAFRSLFFAPAHIDRFVTKTYELSPDVLVFDLEDSVPNDLKNKARENISNYNFSADEKSSYMIRTNPIGSNFFNDDLYLIKSLSVDPIILIPKIRNIDDLSKMQDSLKQYDLENIPKFLLIENAEALLNLNEIIKNSNNVCGLVFGHEDYLNDIDGLHLKDNSNLSYARSLILNTAKAFKMLSIDTPYLNLKDLDGCKQQAIYGYSMGFDGMLVLHPFQIDVVNKCYSPTKDQVTKALEIIDQTKIDRSTGVSISFRNDSFIAPPIIKQAKNLIKKAINLNLIEKDHDC